MEDFSGSRGKKEACQIGSKAAGALVLIWQAAQPVMMKDRKYSKNQDE
jgi:hypothetical protein